MNLTLFPPDSSWTPPREYPNLHGEKILGIDLETKDPLLHERGPGSFRKDGHVVGVSLATLDRGWYFPLRHQSGGNLPLDPTLDFLRDIIKEERTWVGANLQYEMEWLASEGMTLRGKHLDVQIIEALIDEERETNALDSLCQTYLGKGKDEALLRRAAADAGVDPKKELWRLHSKYVGSYAEFDSLSAMLIAQKQMKEVQAQDLSQILTLECQVLPLLWEMRRQGIRVDLEAASKLSKELLTKEDAVRMEVREKYNMHLDEWSGQQLAHKCQELGISYPHTAKGNPSFTGEWLDDQEHHFLQCVAKVRELNRLRQTFVEDWIFKHEIDGVIHPSWKQLVSDDGGTRTGRMAASDPNPQQVPARSDLAPLVRKLFIPPEGEKWNKLDYSQQEPRLLVHYACACGKKSADLVRMAYVDNPKMDIYQFMAEVASVARQESKTITLGRCYGMGAPKLAAKLGVSLEVAKKKLAEFDQALPFIKETSDLCALLASKRGYIKTLCGRRRHFTFWENVPLERGERSGYPVRGEANAKQAFRGQSIRRAYTHKALNALIQGSAADMTKSAMVLIRQETGRIPLLAVHDELGLGARDEVEALQQKELAENCVELCVPMRADMNLGEHWK